MIGTHCGKRMWTVSDNPVYFRKKCQVCGKVFLQHKRQPTTPKTNAPRPKK
jgi:hypothetical protein